MTVFLLPLTLVIGGNRCSALFSDDATVRVVVSEGPELPSSMAGHVGGIVGHRPVVAGGSRWSVDQKTKRWLHECFVFRDGPSLPGPCSDAAYVTGSRGLYLAGGTNGKQASTQVLFLADTSANASWQPLASLPQPIEAASGVLLSDKFYVIGGFSGDRASSQIWELDLDSPTATRTERAPLPAEGRGYAAVTAVGSQLYVFGGFTSPPSEPQTKIFGDADRYEPATNVWKRLEGFDMPGYAWTATAIGERQILLIGRVPKLKTVTDEVGLVDLETMKARSIGRLITPACCMPAMPNGVKTWWFPGGDPDTNRNRTTRTSILTF